MLLHDRLSTVLKSARKHKPSINVVEDYVETRPASKSVEGQRDIIIEEIDLNE